MWWLVEKSVADGPVAVPDSASFALRWTSVSWNWRRPGWVAAWKRSMRGGVAAFYHRDSIFSVAPRSAIGCSQVQWSAEPRARHEWSRRWWPEGSERHVIVNVVRSVARVISIATSERRK